MGLGDGCRLLYKIRKVDFHVGFFGVEFLLYLLQDFSDRVDMYFSVVFVQYLDKSTHMRTPETMGKVHVHVDRCHGVLSPVGPVENGDGIAQVFPDCLVLGLC